MYNREYYLNHREERLAKQREYDQAHREEKKIYMREYMRKWSKNHPKTGMREGTAKSYCCEEVELIENYELAKANNFKGWHCHHRLETHYEDGSKRTVNLSGDYLREHDMYYNRPASELIFLRKEEHIRIHHLGITRV